MQASGRLCARLWWGGRRGGRNPLLGLGERVEDFKTSLCAQNLVHASGMGLDRVSHHERTLGFI